MTEMDWLTCPDPNLMLRWLIFNKASERKLRLFVVACARRVLAGQGDDDARTAVGLAQIQADGRAPPQDIWRYQSLLYGTWLRDIFAPAANAADSVSLEAAILKGRGSQTPAFYVERQAQTELIREVFGNPLRPAVLERTWMEWENGFIRSLAQGIYLDRTLHRFTILADALEDAGCSDDTIIGHLRSAGPHYLGCWCLDALAGMADLQENDNADIDH